MQFETDLAASLSRNSFSNSLPVRPGETLTGSSLHSSLARAESVLRLAVPAMLACVTFLATSAQAQPIPLNWTSERTFDVTNFPLGTAVKTFSSSSPFELADVNFSHTIDARDDGSLRLFGGTFEISADIEETVPSRHMRA